MKGTSESKASPQKDKEAKEGKPKTPSSLSLYSIFWFADGFDWFLILVGTLGSIGTGLAIPINILLFDKVLNAFGQNTDRVSQYALYTVYLGIAICASAWAEISCWMYTAERQTTKMRYKYLEAILNQDVAVFDTQMRTGAVLDSFTTDFPLIQESIGDKMGSFICHLSTLCAGFALSLSYVWRVALLVLTIVPLVVVVGAVYTFALSKLTSKGQRALGAAATIVEEMLAQIRTVYSYVGESKAMESYSKKLKSTVKLGYQEGFVKGVGAGAITFIIYAAWGMISWYGGVLTSKKIANAGDILSSIFNILIGVVSIGYVLSSLTSITKGTAAYSNIIEIINQASSLNHNLIDGLKPDQLQGTIEFKNVGFSYPSRPNVKVLQNFDLHIPAGKTLALVGGSGSGKSTIISLLEKFYNPTQGQILVDELDIKTLNTKWLRQQIGLISQEPVLFSTSIRENILYGKEDANEGEVIAAAQAANAHDFISEFPGGYETKAGERGVQLSGGQKQRIAIARAIIKNPKILLLDEATSALDSASEQLVQMALNQIMVDRTTVVVAHRLSTIKDVDTIAVLKYGRIVEMGNLDQLIANGYGGGYFSHVNLQAPDYAIEQAEAVTLNSSENQESCAEALVCVTVENKKKISETGSEVIESKASVWRLLKMSATDWPSAILGTLGSLLLGSLTPVLGLFMAESIATLFLKDYAEMERQIRIKTFLYIGVAVTALVGNTLQQYFLGIMGENLSRRVREKMLAAILRNEVGWFDKEENSSLRASSRMSSDGTLVKTVIGEIFLIVQNLTTFIISLTICFRAQWQMSLLLLATYPLLATAAIVQKLSMKGFGGDQVKAHSEATVVAGEAVSNIRTLVAFTGENKVLYLFQNLLSKPVKRSFRRGHIAGLIYGFSQLGLFCSYGLALWNASRLVHNGTAHFSDVIVVYMILVFGSFALSETMILAPDVAKSREALKSVFEILDRKTLMEPEDSQALKVKDLKGDIEFRRVKFCYPSRPLLTVFENLELKLKAGSSLALVGASGCGKSSIIALIERFYDPTSGIVLIDGLDIKSLHLRSLRMHIALVQQEPALFATSIRENILYGNELAMEDEVTNAAKIANAHEFISKLPDGYGTIVGERGVEMSGGQKQRLAIARAVLKGPAILLLDEATSGLDAESERVVQEALERVMEGRTCIVVAHRLSTIKNVPTIAVVKDGKITEQGSHTQLMGKPNGEYYRLLNINANLQPASIE